VTGTNWPKPSYTLLATGLCRFKIDDLLQETPYLVAKVTQLDKLNREDADNEIKSSEELMSLAENFREQAAMLVDMLDISIPMVAKLKKMLDSVPIQHLPDICTSLVKASYAEKIQVLDAVDISERFKKTLPLLMRQIEGLKLLQKAKKTSMPLIPRTSGVIGRKGFRTLGDGSEEDEEGDDGDEMADFERKIKASGMPAEAHKASMRELKRLKKMPQQMPEHAMIRNYLELMVELPWSKTTTDMLDIAQARKDLDVDHYGLDKLKKRVIEYLAVRQIKNSLRGPILCFVGPPGVGKTSVGRSVAKTLGREFHRIALGGVCDQSDIRGHRRTYIGSMPGRIIQGLKQVGVRNPVFLLDEIDKLSHSLHGDPAAALLEVLDPEQNHTFVDHYLNVPFDLSQVLFIATANSLSTIPPPLLDRMELIQVPGYTQEEKFHIAVRHLVPKQLKEHGLTANQHLTILDDSIRLLISSYTREAGVRTLERRIGALCRAVAVKVAEHQLKVAPLTTTVGEKVVDGDRKMAVEISTDVKKSEEKSETVDITNLSALTIPPQMPIVIDPAAVEDILGPPMFTSEIHERLSQPGVAIGLAWTAMGGEIMYVEATQMAGDGKLTLTGQLGDVMKESANLALNWLRSNARRIGIDLGHDLLENTDVHIHFPAGAISKDGPSAGVAIATVLVSLFSGRCVRSDTAMTGEVTLRGLVLPVGGIKEKVLAAHRVGVTRIVLPKRNEKDLHEVPSDVQKSLDFIFVSNLDEVLGAVFEGGFGGWTSDKPVTTSSKL
jgi:ATP-dependent Lon protease